MTATTQAAPPSRSPARTPQPHPTSICEAERELGAFLEAVRRQNGEDVARHAADDWLEALARAERPTNLRRVTLDAANRIASYILGTAKTA